MIAPDSQPPGRKRPVLVTILFILFCLAVPFWLAAIITVISQPMGRTGNSIILAVVVPSLIMLMRGIGMVRLFLMKPDAWIALSTALVLELPVAALQLFRARTEGLEVSQLMIATAISWAIAVGIIVYAYRLFHGLPPGAEVPKAE